MSSSDNSERRIRELVDKLVEEQLAHQQTQYALRDAREKLESENKILDLDALLEKHRLENLKAENEDLKETLKTRDEKIEELKKQLSNPQRSAHNIVENYNRSLKNGNESSSEQLRRIEDLESKNSSLQKANEEKTESTEKLNTDLACLQEKLTRSEDNRNELRIRKEQSEEELQRVNQILKDKMDKIEDLKEILSGEKFEVKRLEEEVKKYSELGDQLRRRLEQSQTKGMHSNLETRLEEYKAEVERLRSTKEESIRHFQDWTYESREIINGLVSNLEKKRSREIETLVKLEEEAEKFREEHWWWVDYSWVSQHLSSAFDAIQIMRSSPDPGAWLMLNQVGLSEKKESFDEDKKELKKESREWIGKELESKYFETFEELVASRRARTPSILQTA